MVLLAFNKFTGAVPVRFNLWIMIFTSCWVVYMLRVNMSLNIIAMVPQRNSHNTTSVSQCNAKDAMIRNVTLQHEDIADVRQAPREALCQSALTYCMLALGGVAKTTLRELETAQRAVLKVMLSKPRRVPTNDLYKAAKVLRTPGAASFEWTPEQQAMILGSYFWCYPVTSLVGGMAAERWGPRYMVLITSALGALLTIASPAAARLHYIALVVVRFLLGIAGGFIYPALHALVARWAPPTEKGKFISAMMGGTLGTVVTWSVTGPLVEKFGWESAFYIPGALALVWCALWWYLVADTPADHPRISDTERKYISDALGDKVQKSKGLPPFKSIVTSLPFLAMVVLHYGNLWGLYFIMTVGPKFVSSVLGFQLSAAGVISALPYLARLFLSAIFGVIGDCILARNLMSTTKIRKFFCLFSHIIPGLFLVLLVYAGCSTALSVALITLSMGANGAATLTNLQNHQDLAPNYAGSLYGIANAVGSTAGFFTPMITAYFTSDGNGFEQWRPVFFIGASVYIVSAIFFIFFGTGEIQKWNFSEKDRIEIDNKQKNGDLREPKDTPLSVVST